jgi:dihydroflavonol-4-reductase
MNKKTCFVTGATGCLGRNLIDVLIKDDWKIIVLHRESSNVKIFENNDNIETRQVNLHDIEDVQRVIGGGGDALFHLAANVSHDHKNLDEQYLDNVVSTRNLALSSIGRIKRFIYCSTGAVGLEGKIESNYVRTKAISEQAIQAANQQGLDTVILRPIICVGRYDNRNYSKIVHLIKKGAMKRAIPGSIVFCSASAVAEAHLSAYKNGGSGQTYWLGGELVSWYSFMNEIAKNLNKKIKPPYSLKFFRFLIQLQQLVVRNPEITTILVDLICSETGDVLESEYTKSFVDLGYKPKTLSFLVKEMCDWVEQNE